jgi:type IV pilus assembly protein PilF
MKYAALWCLIAAVGLSACSTAPPAPKGAHVNLKQAAIYNAQLGAGYLDQGNLELSKHKFEKALDEDPALPEAHSGYALLMSRLGETGKAEKHFKKALKLDPANSNTLNNYGTFLCGQNKIKQAEQQFIAALRDPLYRTPEFAFTNAGRCYLKVDDRVQAEAYFGKALQVNPKFPGALFEMALLQQKAGKQRVAYEYLKKYEKHGGAQTAASLWLAVKLTHALGDKNAEASYALLLKNKYPDSEEAAFLRSARQR